MVIELQEASWQAVRGGDQDAFTDIMTVLVPAGERFVWGLIGGVLQTDDIIQNALIALYRSRKRVEDISHAKAFFFRVLRNQCYDLLRREGRYEQVALDTVAPITLVQELVSPEDESHWRMVYDTVMVAIDQLPEIHKECLLLSYEMGLTQPEVAEVMNISVGTVKSRLFHARKQLQRLLPPDILSLVDD